MTEPGAISRLLSAHRGLDPPPPPTPPRRAPQRATSSESKARLLDASLGVLSAIRVLTEVAEDVLLEQRERLSGSPEPSPRKTRERGHGDGDDPDETYERIPLSY
jgi:hypothetical protein